MVWYFTNGLYTTSEILTFISAVAPVTGIFAFTYWKYINFAQNELRSEIGKEISTAAWVTQISVIGIFSVAVLFLPVYFFTGDATEQDLPSTLAIVETIFGIYLARSFSTLFPVEVLGEVEQN